MKNVLKRIAAIIGALLVVFLLIAGIFTYLTRIKIGDIDASVSPNGEYEILYQSVGEPDWLFGYSHARLVLQRNGKTLTKYKFDVANDGGILYPDNWDVSWSEDSVAVTISGEEQSDVTYTFCFDDYK